MSPGILPTIINARQSDRLMTAGANEKHRLQTKVGLLPISISEFLVSVVQRWWERSKQKFGFIK